MKGEEAATLPLVIVDRSGQVVDVATMNRKAFTKSTEHGELWVVHPETGRVLPYDGKRRFERLQDEGSWYRAVLEDDSMHRAGDPADTSRGSWRPEDAETVGGVPAAGRVLHELWAVIEQRKSERPEGSYTTYLFEAGEEKIRKKTGEEAIELVLARDREEVISEAADLIYHLLVLLNQLEIPLEDVLGELTRRA